MGKKKKLSGQIFMSWIFLLDTKFYFVSPGYKILFCISWIQNSILYLLDTKLVTVPFPYFVFLHSLKSFILRVVLVFLKFFMHTSTKSWEKKFFWENFKYCWLNVTVYWYCNKIVLFQKNDKWFISHKIITKLYFWW